MLQCALEVLSEAVGCEGWGSAGVGALGEADGS